MRVNYKGYEYVITFRQGNVPAGIFLDIECYDGANEAWDGIMDLDLISKVRDAVIRSLNKGETK